MNQYQPPKIKLCGLCGKDFFSFKSPTERIYCSKECSSEMIRRANRENMARVRLVNHISIRNLAKYLTTLADDLERKQEQISRRAIHKHISEQF